MVLLSWNRSAFVCFYLLIVCCERNPEVVRETPESSTSRKTFTLLLQHKRRFYRYPFKCTKLIIEPGRKRTNKRNEDLQTLCHKDFHQVNNR